MPQVDEIVMRELMRDATSDLFAPPGAAAGALRHQRRRQLRTRMIGAGATAAVAGLAVGVVVTTSGGGAVPGGRGTPAVHTAQLTAAQQTLYSLSSASAASSHPAGRFVVMAEKTVSDGATGPKTSVIDTVTGTVITYQDLSGIPKGTPVPPAVLKSGPGSSPTQAQLNGMPTDPGKLKAEILAQARQQLALAQQQVAKKNGGAKTAPISQSTDNDLVFSGATDLLWQPNLSPAVRAAIYKVLAATPGVAVNSGAHDSAGRPAVEISRVNNWGKANVMTFENPKSGATLETASQLPGEGLSEDLYLSVKYSNSIPGNPYQH